MRFPRGWPARQGHRASARVGRPSSPQFVREFAVMRWLLWRISPMQNCQFFVRPIEGHALHDAGEQDGGQVTLLFGKSDGDAIGDGFASVDRAAGQDVFGDAEGEMEEVVE